MNSSQYFQLRLFCGVAETSDVIYVPTLDLFALCHKFAECGNGIISASTAKDLIFKKFTSLLLYSQMAEMVDNHESDMKELIALLPSLGGNGIHIKHPGNVATLLNKLVSAGIKALQVIADFDHTITKQHINGEKHTSSFCVINNCTCLPSHFREKDRVMVEKYVPIERDPHLSKAEKTPHMVEWYTITGDLYTGFALSADDISKAVEKTHTELRTKTLELISDLDSEDVPFLVFSAGLGDVVHAILKHHGVVNKNIHVISNFLKYKDGQVDGFTSEIVHPFNKNGKAAAHTKYFELMSSRHNVILMGDSLGDAEMADGVPNTDAVLKIGFLYGDIPRLLPQYMDHFDIVLVDDQTMDVPSSIVSYIKGKSSKI